MLNILSIIIGIIAIPFILLGSIPFLALTLWLIIIVPIIGAVVGMLSSKTSGRNFNLVLVGVAALWLFLGGGII